MAGSNGGHATLNARRQALAGNITVGKASSATINLAAGPALNGAVNVADTAGRVTLCLDDSSTWTVTGTSHLIVPTDGTTTTNITGNGHTVHYDTAASPALDGKTYTLANGGTLTPAR